MKTTNKTTRILLCIIVICIAAFMSCSKNDDNNPDPTKEQTDVYIVGRLNDGSSKAGYWKNDVFTPLTDGSKFAEAFSIYVLGNDVYAAGYVGSISENRIAKLWKNGTETSLTDGTRFAQALAVFVSGTDVYVAGYEDNGSGNHVAKLWKNGVATNLSDGSTAAIAASVFVSGNDVYVCGRNGYAAVVWKNGTETKLTDGTKRASASSVFVSGNDVYIAGGEAVTSSGTGSNMNKAKVWKNKDVLYTLTDGGKTANANSVYVSGSDVYAVGYEMDNATGETVATFWQNGIASNLSIGEYTSVNSVCVSDGDVYVAGSDEAFPYLWKNGTPQKIADKGEANGVFVVKH